MIVTVDIELDPKPRTAEAFDIGRMMACGEMPAARHVLDATIENGVATALVRFTTEAPKSKKTPRRDPGASHDVGVA